MEIERLHKMLTEAGIEHDWVDRTPDGWDRLCRKYPDITNFGGVWGYQIIVYKKNGDRLISAIEGRGTYGYIPEGDEFFPPSDLIEIMGLLTPEEEERGSVVGYLTAEEVFRRIMEYAVCGST